MSRYVYVVTEGVLDVVFLGKLLQEAFGFSRVKRLDALDGLSQQWLRSFKWPVLRKGVEDIGRLSVPAPVFYAAEPARTVAFRNSQGVSGIRSTLEADWEFFSRAAKFPDAVGVVLDADNEDPQLRFSRIAAILEALSLPRPARLAEIVRVDSICAGVFSLPGGGGAGALEDVLLPVGREVYPDFHQAAETYVSPWRAEALVSEGAELRELKLPSGEKKAVLSAVAALLKPGKPLRASLEDHAWISPATLANPALGPCKAFLTELLQEPVPAMDVQADG